MNPDLVQAEYELILYAARDEVLAAELNTYERKLESRISDVLGRYGAPRPSDGARTILEMIRGFELARLTRPNRCCDELARRLASVVSALTHEHRRSGHRRPPQRPRTRRR